MHLTQPLRRALIERPAALLANGKMPGRGLRAPFWAGHNRQVH